MQTSTAHCPVRAMPLLQRMSDHADNAVTLLSRASEALLSQRYDRNRVGFVSEHGVESGCDIFRQRGGLQRRVILSPTKMHAFHCKQRG
eukprot:m.328605 g.328605  ORF g.328605 m.328605 type:complete len:89 (+) comp20435_c0_seq1:912-1178(+)